MQTIGKILEQTQHRPWPLPSGRWRYYQEWNNALFLHWRVPEALLTPLVPSGLRPDIAEGSAWVSLVAFTMQQIRPRYLPAFPPVSDFHELNLRTYVQDEGKAGVYFLSIEAQKAISVFIARKLSGLPYEKASMQRSQTGETARFSSENNKNGFSLKAEFRRGAILQHTTPLDRWLTERYCLYVDKEKELYRFDIQHLPWQLRTVNLDQLEVNYDLGAIRLSERRPDLVHYSEGVQVIAWGKTSIFS